MAQHDIFICFSSKDKSDALKVVAFLEKNGFKCWISSRDVGPGKNYQRSIVEALEAAKLIVFLFSDNSAQSNEITKELSLGASENIAVIPLRLTAVKPSGALRYELATRQWIDAFEDPDNAFEKLLDAVRAVLDSPGDAPAAPASPPARERKAAAAPDARASVPVVHAGTDEFEAVRGMLARHVGPIAKVLMQKAASEAQSVDDFCDRLAAYVPVPGERTAFRQAARARLTAKS